MNANHSEFPNINVNTTQNFDVNPMNYTDNNVNEPQEQIRNNQNSRKKRRIVDYDEIRKSECLSKVPSHTSGISKAFLYVTRLCDELFHVFLVFFGHISCI